MTSQELKDKLKNESESLKQVALQRELDNKDFQMRIDKLVSFFNIEAKSIKILTPDWYSEIPLAHATFFRWSQSGDYVAARENLVVAQTKQEHLEARVKELSGQITMKEDRLKVYERYGVSNTSTNQGSGDGNGAQASTLSQQQKLEIENAQLKWANRYSLSDLFC